MTRHEFGEAAEFILLIQESTTMDVLSGFQVIAHISSNYILQLSLRAVWRPL